MDTIPHYSRYEPESGHIENVVLGSCAAVATGTLGVLSAYIAHPTQDSFSHVRAPASHSVSDALTVVLLGLSLVFGRFTYSHFRNVHE